MLRGELHNRGSAGRCEACGEIFPCPTALAVLDAVKNEVEQLTPAQVTDGARCPACGSMSIGDSNIPSDQAADDVADADQLRCADCGRSLEGTTPVREPWYTPDPDSTGPRLCGFCYSKHMGGVARTDG